jgi:DNA-binding NarL/FixJ family response regulator
LARIRLLVAENHKDMREKILGILEHDFSVVGVVCDGLDFMEAASRMKPDLCIIDISMPTLSGIDAAIQLRERGSEAKIVFLTVDDDPDFVRAAMAAGASAYVSKSEMATDLVFAIKEVLAGRLFVSPSVPYVTQKDPSEYL